MKQRIITAIAMFAVVIPIFYFKIVEDVNTPIYILALILTIVATTEIISMKESERSLPTFVRLVMYLSVLFLSFQEILTNEWGYEITLDILPFVVIILGMMMILNHRFIITDAGFVLFTTFYLGLSFAGLFHFFIKDVYELMYLVFIAIATDTFAYFTGVFFGKHKLCPRISPKKTIEGSVGGSLIATLLVTIYAYFVLDKTNLLLVIPVTLLLTILSQFGDLIASVLKRHYKIKDYGNLFPGHGGVLDRLDSVLFTALAYSYILVLFELFKVQF
jgi:phosphatidate cytidylyltransferase